MNRASLRRAGLLAISVLLAASLSWPGAGLAVADVSDDPGAASAAPVSHDGEFIPGPSPEAQTAEEGKPEPYAADGDSAASPQDDPAYQEGPGEPDEVPDAPDPDAGVPDGADGDASRPEGQQPEPVDEDAGDASVLELTMAAPSLRAGSPSTGIKAQYASEYDPNDRFPGSDANGWQVVSGGYDEIKAGSGTYKYGAGNAVRMQKAVIPAGTENEFQVYLNVEPQVSWEEFFKSLDNYQTHNSSSTFNPSSGCSRLYSEEEYNDMTPEEQALFSPFTVAYTMSDGRVFEVTRYGNFTGRGKDAIQNVPNGSYAWSSEKFNTNGLINHINWRPLVAGSGRLEVDASGIEQRFSFATDIVYPRTVTDPMGDGIIYQGKISFDEGSVVEPGVGTMGGTLEWSLPTAEYPDPPYFSFHTEEGTIPGTNVQSLVTVVDNIEVVEIDGKHTAYYTGVLEGRYAITLDVEDSCAPLNDSPADSIKPTNGETVLSYDVGNSPKTDLFDVPEIRGLLYDLEVLKVDDGDPAAAVEGAAFALYGEDGTVIALATSASDGSVKFRDLDFGSYTIEELSAPAGYRMADDGPWGPYELCYTTNPQGLVQDHGGGHEADLPADVANMIPGTMPFQVVNPYVMSLTILKQDGDTQEPLCGVRFALLADDGSAANVFLDSDLTVAVPSEGAATGEDGRVSFYGLEPGVYWIVEPWTIAGYKTIDEPVRVEVTADHRVLFFEPGVEVLPDASHNVSITIDNFKIPPLPAAGSAGRLLLTGAGLAAIVLSALIWAGSRRGRRGFRVTAK